MSQASLPSDAGACGGPATGLNLAVVCGPCPTGVEVRTLASGRRVALLAVRTQISPARARGATVGSRATSVPVTVWEPPAWLETLEPGAVVIVVGSIRRRFFATRTGARGAKSELEAVTIARGTPRQLQHAWRRAASALEVLT